MTDSNTSLSGGVLLWEDERRTASRAWGSPMCHGVDVDFELPGDQPATTLGGGSEGIRWELQVKASVPGLHYVGRFRVPVLEPGVSFAADRPENS